MTALSPSFPATAATRMTQAASPTRVATLPLRAGASASLGMSLSGWAVPLVGAVAGGLLFGMPGAIIGGVLGYLLVRH